MTETVGANAAEVGYVAEARLAELVGLTARTLQSQRLKGKIPKGVWAEVNGRILYCVEAYNQWLRNQFFQPELRSVEKPSGSGSTTKANGSENRTRTRQHRPTSNAPVVYAVK